MESARLACKQDTSVLGDLAVEAREEMRTKRGGDVLDRLDTARDDPKSSMERIFEAKENVVVLGTIDDVPVGFGFMKVTEVADGAGHAFLEILYVDPSGRSVGGGEAMLGLLIQEAIKRGAVGIEAVALPGDRATKNFFETHGMTARAITVHRELV